MARDILTDRKATTAKSKVKEYLLADGDGLFLRVRPTGAKDWMLVYTHDGARKKMGLGKFDDVPLARAREKANLCRADLADGIDPKTAAEQCTIQDRAEREARVARLTVNGLFTRWQELELSQRKDKGAEIARSFGKDVLPAIGGLFADEVKRAQVATLLDDVVARGARIVARNMLGDLRQMFGFAIRRGLLENDPTSHMKRDDYGKKVERDRVLPESEIRALPGLIAGAGMLLTSSTTIWIMLATCCSVGELSTAAWADVDLESKQWRIPPENSKNGKAHLIDLSDFAVRQFETLKAITGTTIDEQGETVPGKWGLPAKHNEGPVCVKSLAKQIGDRQREGAPMKNRSPLVDTLKLPGGKWTPHDLRRTGATMMGALGVLPEVVERCLNHTEQNTLKRIYQRHDHREEMRAAWNLLGARLDLLTRPDADNVVTFKRAA